MNNLMHIIVFNVNVPFFLMAFAVASGEYQQELTEIKKSINYNYNLFVNELHSNRYLIGNCSGNISFDRSMNTYNDEIKYIVSLYNQSTTPDDKRLENIDRIIVNCLMNLREDVKQFEVCRTKNKTFKIDENIKINVIRAFLLNKNEEISRYNWILKNFRPSQSEKEINDFQRRINSETMNNNLSSHDVYLNLRQVYYNTLNNFNDKFEFILYCTQEPIQAIRHYKTFIVKLKTALSKYENYGTIITMHENEIAEKSYKDFKNHLQYIDECTNLTRKVSEEKKSLEVITVLP
ncbi:uncharacterized protein LOC122505933 [Leptopilina heterotoma]|uniref:uncharacterized protein LOC122505933 n=1 Tax=Leptopilina heterotoma TaxID=63436 RepID=UPI001CA94490|nr:uncharacterized protein LOC122505933 [Leptopilina heterotoma]